MQDAVSIKVKRLSAEAKLPKYAHAGPWGDLAADLYAAVAVMIGRGETALVSTGIAIEFPSEYGALVEDRSGLAVRGITTLAGVIDPGYRGEIKVVVANLSGVALEIAVGDRIAQLRLVRRIEARFEEVPDLEEAAYKLGRGEAGFGSTGT
jgi:dUTP pyrophosphatase